MQQLDTSEETGSGASSNAQSRRPILDRLLQSSSRTFALTIPVLPEPLQAQIGLAYLLLRAADGIEDATQVAANCRLDILASFVGVLEGTGDVTQLTASLKDFVTQMPEGGERDVVEVTELLVEELCAMSAKEQFVIRKHCSRVARRMASWLSVSQGTDGQQLKDLGELSDYMYSVAGIVGELLTDLFALYHPGAPHLRLMCRAADFGAGLQLTNIIRDAAEDARMNRHFLPSELFYVKSETGLEQLEALVEMARIR